MDTQKSTIHFSHANGFPAETYRKMFRELEPDFTIGYIPMLGHDPKYPIDDNWERLAQELIDYIATHYTQKVIGVGHSLGGVLTFLAAVKRPELFEQIILLDSPILGGIRSVGIKFAKLFGFIDRVTHGRVTKRRRTKWASIDEAVSYFRQRAIFKDFDNECLEHYILYGTERTAEGIELKFDYRREYEIYCTLPHNLTEYKNQLKIPSSLIYGKNTYALVEMDRKFMEKYFKMNCIPINGGHLFPFEYPQLTAQTIRKIILEKSSRN